jgi:CRISPR-associated protein Cmr2
MSHFFHFTLGPVQGFVAQARRTRDFWAGSFVLSWLAAVAMREVKQQRGTILFPLPDDAFLAALDGNPGRDAPAQGNIPNRFFAEVPDDFDPQAVTAAVQTAWRALAETVWQHDLADHADADSRAIWERQVQSYWDMSWARSPDRDDSAILDRRKNWRSHLPPAEPGIKCMVMDGLQELSGARSPLQPAAERLDTFWSTLRDSGHHGIRSDLADGEHLCAIAYIKRRFPRYFKQVRADIAGGWTAHGWRVPTAVPSVAYLAAAPWLASLIDANPGDILWQFHDAAQQLSGGEHPEWASNVRCVREVDGPNKWKSLDGGVLFDHSLDNPRLWSAPEHAPRVKQLLGRLRRGADLEAVSPFYAVLLMDGDSLGKEMAHPQRQSAISQALAAFTRQAPAIVDRHSGFLVYSGGDDVLALLPLEYALPCAAALRRLYLDCFADTNPRVQSTLSGAIQYAHVKMPLTRVLQDAHQLLDAIAKDQTGRDAIACRVWKPGGLGLTWAMPWQDALQQADADQPIVILQQLAEQFRADDHHSGFANRFIYRIRERLELLNPVGGGASPLQQDQAAALMAAEYLGSGINQGRPKDQRIDIDQAIKDVTPLLQQCQRVRRVETGSGFKLVRDNHWSADAALLLRFLAHKGIER